MFNFWKWGSKPEAARDSGEISRLEGALPHQPAGLPNETGQGQYPAIPAELSTTESEGQLSRRQIYHAKSLIMNEDSLSPEVKVLARFDMRLLIDIVDVLSEPINTSDPSAAYKVENLHQALKEANQEIGESGVALTFPKKSELAELKEILLEVRNALPSLDASSSVLYRTIANVTISQLRGTTKIHAELVYELFGSRKDIFKLATEYPELFKKYLSLFRESRDGSDDQTLRDRLQSTEKQIERLKLHPPLFRELRKFEERLSEYSNSSTTNPFEVALLEKSLEHFNALKGLDKAVALKIWEEFGWNHLAFLAATRAPVEFRLYLAHAKAVKENPSDQQSIDNLKATKEKIAAYGIKLPRDSSLDLCLRIAEEVENDRVKSAIAEIQKEIDENEGFDLEDSDPIDLDDDLATDVKALRRLLGDDS
jgi:hypothetical protein